MLPTAVIPFCVAVFAIVGLAGCGMGPVSPTGSGSPDAPAASGLLAPKLPADRPLAVDERQGDFDSFLKLATGEARRWDTKAKLSGAQAINVDAQGRKAGGTQYTYSFSEGRHGLTVTIAGNNVAFEKAKSGSAIAAGALVPAAQVLQAALASTRVTGESFILVLGQPAGASAPVFLVVEHRQEGRRLTVNAQTGAVLADPGATR